MFTPRRAAPGRSAIGAVTLVAMLLAPQLASAATYMRIYRDESKIIRVDGLKRVSITNPRIAAPVIISPAEVMVNGLSIGRTSLYIWDQAGRTEIQVVVRPFTEELEKKIIDDINDPNIKVQLIAEGETEKVFLRGTVDTNSAHRSAVEVATAYLGGGNVIDLIEVRGVSESPRAQLERLISNPEIKVQVVTQQLQPGQTGNPPIAAIILEGFVEDQRDHDRALAIARSFVGGNTNLITNLLQVVNPLQVQVEAHLLELTRNGNSNLGVTWGSTPTAITDPGGGFATATFTQFTQGQTRFIEDFLFGVGRGPLGSTVGPEANQINDIKRLDPTFAILNYALSSGNGRVIENPKVVTRSGQRAHIFVGGEIGSIISAGFGTQAAEFRQFGLDMTITPTVDHKGNINTESAITLSTPDASLGANLNGAVVSGFRRRSSENTVSVRDGEHIVVSGLINAEEQRLISKVPLLHKIPVLGRLFQSERYQKAETELVIVLTPHLMADESTRRRIDAAQAMLPKSATDPAPGAQAAAPGRVGNQDMVKQVFASMQGAAPATALAARPGDEVAAVPVPASSRQADPLTGDGRLPGAGRRTLETGGDPSKSIREILRRRSQSGRGEQTRQTLARLDPGARAQPEPVLQGAAHQAAGEVDPELEPPALPAMVPVQGTISSRIHGIFAEAEDGPGRGRARPEVQAAPAPETPAQDSGGSLDGRVDELFHQIRAKLEGESL